MDREYLDDTVDTKDDVEVVTEEAQPEVTPEKTDSYGKLQERIAGSKEDDPWYSASTGAVVDSEGNKLINPKTKQPFGSMDDYEKFKAAQPPKPTATPTKQDPEKPVLQKTLNDLVLGDQAENPTIEKLFELSGKSGGYSYNNELVPLVDQNIKPDAVVIDPVEQVRAQHQESIAAMTAPIEKIRAALIAQGADEGLTNQLLTPIVGEVQKQLNERYQKEHELALERRIETKFGEKLSKTDEEKLTSASELNVERIAKQYFPDHGKNAYFALINGGYDAQGKFQRGPAASIVDFAVNVANGGKVYANEADRNAAYVKTFTKLTADPKTAIALADHAYYYWLGKNAQKAAPAIYRQGKESAAESLQRKKATVKTQPASFSAPSNDDEDTQMPSILRSALQRYKR